MKRNHNNNNNLLDGTLAGGIVVITIVLGKHNKSFIGIKVRRHIPLGKVRKAEIGIIRRVLIHAILIVRRGAIAIPIICLTILGPAAHGGMRLARRVVKVGKGAGPRDAGVRSVA